MNVKRSSGNSTDLLSQRLDEVRERLMKIPNVSGVGIGCSSEENSSQIVIQIFVNVEGVSSDFRNRLQEILGTIPYEVVCMPMPGGD